MGASGACEDMPLSHHEEPAAITCGFAPNRQVDVPCQSLPNVPRAASLEFHCIKNHPENLLKYIYIFLGLDPKDAD